MISIFLVVLLGSLTLMTFWYAGGRGASGRKGAGANDTAAASDVFYPCGDMNDPDFKREEMVRTHRMEQYHT